MSRKKKIIGGSILGVLAIAGLGRACGGAASVPATSYTTPTTVTIAPAASIPTTTIAPTTTATWRPLITTTTVAPAPLPAEPTDSGGAVDVPNHAPDVVPGDTAVCNDGTVTHPLHHQGACSHHHGVAKWL
jgi:hypothetical protein